MLKPLCMVGRLVNLKYKDRHRAKDKRLTIKMLLCTQEHLFIGHANKVLFISERYQSLDYLPRSMILEDDYLILPIHPIERTKGWGIHMGGAGKADSIGRWKGDALIVCQEGPMVSFTILIVAAKTSIIVAHEDFTMAPWPAISIVSKEIAPRSNTSGLGSTSSLKPWLRLQ